MNGEEIKQRVYDALDAAGIPYERADHPAVFTIEEMDRIDLPHPEAVVKNLFLRDAKGKRHFLAVLPGHRQADLKTLGELVGSKLSFASEERLDRYLGLTKGSVTPLGVLNDGDRAVEVLLDEGLKEMPLVGVHPNLNTATVFLKTGDLVRLITDHGSKVTWVRLA